MAIIKCGSCRQFHGSVGDVQKCFNREKVEVLTVERPSVPATERQKDYIQRLLNDRVWSGDDFEIETITKDQASGIIGNLLSCPEKAERETSLVVGHISIPSQGKFTVVWGPKDRRTYRFRTSPLDSNFKPGKVIVGYLSGPDNDDDYIEFGHAMTEQTMRIWNKFKDQSMLVDGLRFLLGSMEAIMKAGEMYAVESGNCWRCGRTLTVPASVSRGLGPICAMKLGVD